MPFARKLATLARAMRARSRARRYRYFWNVIGQRVNAGLWLDLGGGPGSYFLAHFGRPEAVVLVDVFEPELREAKERYPGVHCVRADGQRLPFRNATIACTFCNSVIEHVADPRALAIEIQRVSQRFFLQTPNGRFPLETHSLVPIPIYQLLPRVLRRLLCNLFGTSFDYLASVTYVSERELRRLFPGATIARERVLGLVKSYYVFSVREEVMRHSSARMPR